MDESIFAINAQIFKQLHTLISKAPLIYGQLSFPQHLLTRIFLKANILLGDYILMNF